MKIKQKYISNDKIALTRLSSSLPGAEEKFRQEEMWSVICETFAVFYSVYGKGSWELCSNRKFPLSQIRLEGLFCAMGNRVGSKG